MLALHFEGCSDDTFGEYAHTNIDHDNCANGKPIRFTVAEPGATCGLMVVGQYAAVENVGWIIGVGALNTGDEEEPLPEWPMRFERSGRPYSPRLVIEAPDGVEVKYVR